MNETFSNNLLSSSIYHLLNFEKYGNFQVALRQAAINNNFQVVLFSGDFNTILAVETRHNVTLEEAVRIRLDQSSFDANAKGAKLDIEGISTYWGPVVISGERYYLMVVDNDKNYSQDDIQKLAEIIELAMGMWNYVPKRNPAAELIRALRRGNRGLAHSIIEELNLSEKDLEGVFLIPGVKRDDALKKIAAYESKYNLRVLKVVEPDEIVGLLLRSEDRKEFGEAEWKTIAKDMYESGAQKTFHVMNQGGIEGMCNAFALINETEAFVQFIFPYKHSFSKFELALAGNCVNICMNGGSVKRNYMDLIKPFKNGQDAKTRQLMETLEVFVLDAGLSAAKTSSILNIHVNTVQYRLKRIREILGVDITANTIIPGLIMALAVSRIEKEAGPF